MSKRMTPPFKLSDDKFAKISDLKGKSKPLSDYLKIPKVVPHTRKDLDPNWDSIF